MSKPRPSLLVTAVAEFSNLRDDITHITTQSFTKHFAFATTVLADYFITAPHGMVRNFYTYTHTTHTVNACTVCEGEKKEERKK